MDFAAARRYGSGQGEAFLRPGEKTMNTPADQRKDADNLAMIAPARDRSAKQSLAILEQMYGYFSYEPMPLEAERRLAA